MYESHFGLQCDAFAVSPDPQFLFSTPRHGEALAGLLYGLRSRKGVIMLTGEVGTGKTLLLRCLIRASDPNRVLCCYVFYSRLTGAGLLRYLLAELGVESEETRKSALILQLSARLVRLTREGVTPVLILDEAQNLSPAALEEVRLLTNLETTEAKLLQVILAGQPELGVKLDSYDLRQLRQRVVLRFDLKPLSLDQTRAYVEARLRQAGHTSGRLFSRMALHRLHTLAQGIPRTINVLCGNALLLAYAAHMPGVSAELIEEAAGDLHLNGVALIPPPLPAASAAPREVHP